MGWVIGTGSLGWDREDRGRDLAGGSGMRCGHDLRWSDGPVFAVFFHEPGSIVRVGQRPAPINFAFSVEL
jgi:hypothetical protein